MTDEVKNIIREYPAKKAKAIAATRAERQAVADWMIEQSIATGHGDTTADLLSELAAHCRSAGWDDAVRALLADDEAAIEVMARTIHADIMENAARDLKELKPLAWEELTSKTKDNYRKTARAALAALRRKVCV